MIELKGVVAIHIEYAAGAEEVGGSRAKPVGEVRRRARDVEIGARAHRAEGQAVCKATRAKPIRRAAQAVRAQVEDLTERVQLERLGRPTRQRSVDDTGQEETHLH